MFHLYVNLTESSLQQLFLSRQGKEPLSCGSHRLPAGSCIHTLPRAWKNMSMSSRFPPLAPDPLSIPFPMRSTLLQGGSAFGCAFLCEVDTFAGMKQEQSSSRTKAITSYLTAWRLFTSLILPSDHGNLEGRDYVLLSPNLTQNKCSVNFKN